MAVLSAQCCPPGVGLPGRGEAEDAQQLPKVALLVRLIILVVSCFTFQVLCCDVLYCAVLCCAVLCRAVPCRAVPCCAVPCRAVLCRAVPCRAVLDSTCSAGIVPACKFYPVRLLCAAVDRTDAASP